MCKDSGEQTRAGREHPRTHSADLSLPQGAVTSSTLHVMALHAKKSRESTTYHRPILLRTFRRRVDHLSPPSFHRNQMIGTARASTGCFRREISGPPKKKRRQIGGPTAAMPRKLWKEKLSNLLRRNDDNLTTTNTDDYLPKQNDEVEHRIGHDGVCSARFTFICLTFVMQLYLRHLLAALESS